jgi:hypothetical protein
MGPLMPATFTFIPLCLLQKSNREESKLEIRTPDCNMQRKTARQTQNDIYSFNDMFFEKETD